MPLVMPMALFLFALSAAPVTPASVAILGGQAGKVLLWRDGKAFRLPVGTPLGESDQIETGPDGKARILFKDDSVLSVGPRSRVVLQSFSAGGAGRDFRLRVLAGRFKIAVAKWFLGPTSGVIETPTSTAGVRGTVVWGDTDLDAVCALEGTVELTPKGGGKTARLGAGQCAGNMGKGRTDPVKPTEAELRRYLAEVTLP